MRKIDSFVNQYSLTKTLQLKLIPILETEEHFKADKVLERDKQRAHNYEIVKGFITEYHKSFIERVLKAEGSAMVDRCTHYSDTLGSNCEVAPANVPKCVELFNAYIALYLKSEKTESDNEELEKLDTSLREYLTSVFKAQPEFGSLTGKEMIKVLLPSFVKTEEDKAIVESFDSFTSYFSEFNTIRTLIYGSEGKANEVGVRIFSQNLPKYLDNCKIIRDFILTADEETVEEIKHDLCAALGIKLKDVYTPYNFFNFMAQSGIDQYNQFIGGYTTPDDHHLKVKGLNELISIHNAKAADIDKLPLAQPLHKQILSDRTTLSFIPDEFDDDAEVLNSIKAFFNEERFKEIDELCELLRTIYAFNANGIFVKSNNISTLSHLLFGNWSAINGGFENIYDAAHLDAKAEKNMEKYIEKRHRAILSIKSRSLVEMQTAVDNTSYGKTGTEICDFAVKHAASLSELVKYKYAGFNTEANRLFANGNALRANNSALEIVKGFLDTALEFRDFCKLFIGTGIEEDKDAYFYGEFMPLFESYSEIVTLYNKVRNYCTKRISDGVKKIKLNFDSPLFLSGVDINKFAVSGSMFMLRDGKYYLGVVPKSSRKNFFEKFPPVITGEESYSIVNFKYLPGPNKQLPKIFLLAKSAQELYGVSDEMLRKYNAGCHKKGDTFDLNFCHELIDYFKSCIKIYPGWDIFNFQFSDTESYQSIGEFYSEVANQGYNMSKREVPVSYIHKLVKSGDLYLFEMYRNDFSQYATGIPDTHSLMFTAAFSDLNMASPNITVNGGAEIFYRDKVVDRDKLVCHRANHPIANKNPLNPKRFSTFNFDIYKDKRYSETCITLNLPMMLNFTADGAFYHNLRVRKAIHENNGTNIIAVTRGATDLLNAVVIDPDGNIIESKSFNVITNCVRGDKSHTVDTDYMELYTRKKNADTSSSWQKSETVKRLLEGYTNRVAHEVAMLVMRYDAVLIMENPNLPGFRNTVIDNTLFQNFEKTIIGKLTYLFDKGIKSFDEVGSVMNAYQLTQPFESFKSIGPQNGFMFFAPASYCQNLDPVTGFVPTISPKYTNLNDARSFVEKFNKISYNKEKGYFEFDVDLSVFDKNTIAARTKWTICSFGNRISIYKSKDFNEPQSRIVNLTQEFKNLFGLYDIDYRSETLKNDIIASGSKDFYYEFFGLFRLMLKMRNICTGDGRNFFISPVADDNGNFFCTETAADGMPKSPDACAAYNLARRGLMLSKKIVNADSEDLRTLKLSLTNAEWVAFAQS